MLKEYHELFLKVCFTIQRLQTDSHSQMYSFNTYLLVTLQYFSIPFNTFSVASGSSHKLFPLKGTMFPPCPTLPSLNLDESNPSSNSQIKCYCLQETFFQLRIITSHTSMASCHSPIIMFIGLYSNYVFYYPTP